MISQSAATVDLNVDAGTFYVDTTNNRVGVGGKTDPDTPLHVIGTVTATTFAGSGASLTSIPNSALVNSSITINSTAVSLGGSLTLTTANIAENTNLYYTNARADARIAAADTDDLSEGSSNLYYTDARVDARVSGGSLGNITTTGYIRGPATFTIDPAAHGDNTGTVVIAGNLQVDGTQTVINSTTLTVDDKNITLASGSANAAAASGAGFTVDIGTGTNPAITYDGTNDEWDFNKNVSIGNMTLSGQEIDVSSGDLTLDVVGDIILDADGGDIKFRDGGAGFFTISNSSLDAVLKVEQSNEDFIIKGNDGGSEITALTLDMSASGAATFNDQITLGGNLVHAGNFTIDAGGDITLDADGGDIKFKDGGVSFGGIFKSGDHLYLQSDISDGDIRFYGSDGGSSITALTLDMSAAGAATFNAGITTGGNVGIGTDLPAINKGSGTASALHLYTAAAAPELRIQRGNGTDFSITASTTGAGANLYSSHGMTFHTNSTTRAVDIDASGNVGIGTTAPAQKLEVNGPLVSTDQLASPGSAGSYTYNATALDYSSNGARLWSWGSSSARGTFNFIQLENDGTNQQTAMTIDSSGNVGIGAAGSSSGIQLQIGNSANNSAITRVTNGTTFVDLTASSSGKAFLEVGSNHPLILATNATERMQITATGNVIVGTTTTNYSTGKLTVRQTPGAPATTGTATTNVGLRVTTNTSNSQALDFGVYNVSPYGSWIQAINSGDLSSTYPIILNPNGGNVGIGTAPATWAKLDILGSGGAQTGATQALQVKAPSATAGEGVGIRLNAASGSHEAVGIIGMVNNPSGNAGAMTFHTYNLGATIPEAMRIDNLGNVGIGTATPGHRLDVEGGNNVFDLARFGSSASDNSEVTIGYFDANANNGIPALITASDFGGLIQGGENGHLVLGIRDNDATDALDIVSGGGNFMTDTTYDTLVATFKANGKVGIGTATPDAVLEINAPSSGHNSSARVATITAPVYPSLEFYSTNTNANNRNWKIASVYNAYGTLEFLQSSAANGAPNQTVMSMDKVGNVGIGTTDNGGRLTIQTADATTNSAVNSLMIRNLSSGTTTTGFGGEIRFQAQRNNGVLQNTGGIRSVAEVNAGTNISSGLAFDVGTAGVNNEALRITYDGNVGIGVTPKTDWHTGYRAIQIGESSAFFANNAADEVFMVQNARYTSSGWKRNSNGNAALFDMQGGVARWRRAANGDDDETVYWSETMFIDTSGNINIGTTNTSGKLHVHGSKYVKTNSGKALGGIHVSPTSPANTGEFGGAISFSAGGTGSSAIAAVNDGGSDNDSTGLAFFVHSSGTGADDATEVVRIDQLGNVGIGTDNPLGPLSVGAGSIADDSLAVQISTGADGTQAYYGVNRNGAYAGLFGYSASSTYKGIIIRNVVASGTANADGISFMTNNSSMRMHITGAGNVGIGTSTPTADLSVGSTTTSSGDVHLRTTKTTFSITPSNTNAGGILLDVGFVSGGQGPMKFGIGGSEKMHILSSGNLVVGDTSQIGTLPTGSKLNIFGDGVTLRLDGSSNATKSILFRGTSVGNPGEIQADGGLRFRTEDANTRITFHTNSTGSNNERMRIDEKGNVQVGDPTNLTSSNTSASIVQVGVPRLTVGSAASMTMAIYDVNTELSHTAGSAVTDAKGSKGTVWRTTSGQIYGPYIDLPRGQYRVSYRIKCNDNTSYENAVDLWFMQ